jgi:hypothetical protein
MKKYIGVLSVFLLAALVAPTQGMAARDHVNAHSAASVETNSELSLRTLKHQVPLPPLIAGPSESALSSAVRDVPSISSRYSIGEQTLLLYVGVGFYGGYSSEFTRSMGGAPPMQSDFGLRSQFGQSVSPNEFQLGVRIPF